ncbi:MAG: hypothetical protein RBR32_11705 [Bacteroidales bacterium]|nr:hypothetical protein [Bacteroidales bacterium]
MSLAKNEEAKISVISVIRGCSPSSFERSEKREALSNFRFSKIQ